MHESSLEFLRCPKCTTKLDLDVYLQSNEIDEGFLECHNCKLLFPIIEKVPILWNDFANYLSFRHTLGGKLYHFTKSKKIRTFLKENLTKNIRDRDRSSIEERWSRIYHESKNSTFYNFMKKTLDSLPESDFVLEYGCSIGILTSHLSNRNKLVIGLDQSFLALREAKNTFKSNLDYVVADSSSHIFGKQKFDLIVALNILELVEPSDLIDSISNQISDGYLVMSDPYDYDRGSNSVKNPLDAIQLREKLSDVGFTIRPDTKKPSFIPWTLKLNSRATLNYAVDLVIGNKSMK